MVPASGRRRLIFAQSSARAARRGRGSRARVRRRSRRWSEQGRPVGMIGDDEPAIEGALPPDAAHAHQAGGEPVGVDAEPAHPRSASRRQRREHQLAGKLPSFRLLGDRRRVRACERRLRGRPRSSEHGAVHEHRPIGDARELGEEALRLADACSRRAPRCAGGCGSLPTTRGSRRRRPVPDPSDKSAARRSTR